MLLLNRVELKRQTRILLDDSLICLLARIEQMRLTDSMQLSRHQFKITANTTDLLFDQLRLILQMWVLLPWVTRKKTQE